MPAHYASVKRSVSVRYPSKQSLNDADIDRIKLEEIALVELEDTHTELERASAAAHFMGQSTKGWDDILDDDDDKSAWVGTSAKPHICFFTTFRAFAAFFVTVVSTGTWGPRVRSDRGKSWEPAHHCTIACDCLCLVTFHCLPGRSITNSSCTWFYCSTTAPP